MDINSLIEGADGFEWDEANLLKLWERHRITQDECEQALKAKPLYAKSNGAHSTMTEQRFSAFGKTAAGRRICIIFTIRRNLIRVISARDMNRRERRIYPL